MPDRNKPAPTAPALWGGYECTVNRVGSQWFDQTVRSGHEHRLSDLDLFAELGIRELRYPALWERISPDRPDQQDWGWTDERLPRIRELGMNPIVTLCHHGSGPSYTSLLDPAFAQGLARHAAAVARRYPWITDWTPVNEPLTTARFSALYGYWYPHLTDESAFWVALLNEIDATRLAMQAVREVNPNARLIQTDDLGFCHATPPLQHEADFQNERRWMGWDLLCGRVTPGHPLWGRLVASGLEPRLRALAESPCPPDVIGINHYLSSERFLDHRVHLHGGRSLADRETGRLNGVTFVDVDAIRNREEGVLGLKVLLRQAWERYGLPIAITECHNGASRDEQARWFVDVWELATELRGDGVDLRAVTAWSLLGSFDWNRMVTRFIGHYEPGVFDVRSGTPRPTLMADVLRALAGGARPRSPALTTDGWWRRSARIDGASRSCPSRFELTLDDARPGPGSVLMIVGGPDEALARLAHLVCEIRGLSWVSSNDGSEQDLNYWRPWAVLDGRDGSALCGANSENTNLDPEWTLAARCSQLGLRHALFIAADRPPPEQLASGRLILACDRIYSPDDQRGAAARLFDQLTEGRTAMADPHAPWREAYGPDVIDAALDLLLDGTSGLINLQAPDRWSEYDFAKTLAQIAGCDPDLVRPHSGQPRHHLQAHPAVISHLPPGETTVERFVRERRRTESGDTTLQRRDDDTRSQSVE